MKRMKAVQVAKANADLEVVERDIPDPKPRQVRIKVQACGICHSDMFTVARSIAGWPSGTAPDSEDTLKFSVMSNVRPMVETFPLAKAADAYQRMMSGKARFRVVLVP